MISSDSPIIRWTSRIAHNAPVWVTLFLFALAILAYAGSLMGGLPGWAARLLDGGSTFTAIFLGIFIEAAPFLLLGTLASGIVEVFIEPEDLVRWIPRQPLLAALAGSMVGMFFPVCECGVVPFARRLMHKGVPVSVGIATLLAAPVLNPIVIASTLAAFGPGPIFWGRMGLSLVIATLTGLFFSLQSDQRALLRGAGVHSAAGLPAPLLADSAEPLLADSAEPLLADSAKPLLADSAKPQLAVNAKPPLTERLRQMLVVTADEFFEMGRFLILGALLAALMQTVLRQSDLVTIGQGPVLSVLALTVLAVLLSICSTVDAFIALAFAGTFTSGAILAFLVYGPMVDIKSTMMFTQVFRPRVVFYLVLLPLLMTLVMTILINFFGVG